MKRTTIVRIAEWTGWCGPCADERPLVLTRTGRHTLRSWLTGFGDTERPLTLTCRLCGIGVVVPPEADDPEVLPEAGLAVASSLEPPPLATPLVADQVEPSLPTSAQDHRPSGRPALIDAQDGAQQAPASHAAAPVPAVAAPVPAVVPLPVLTGPVTALPAVDGELHSAHQAVAGALSELLRRRTVEAQSDAVAPQLPQQRSPEAQPVDGLQALQLLAEGLDLLSAPRR